MKQYMAPAGANAVRPARQERSGFCIDQGLHGGRAPVVIGDLVMGTGQGVDTSIDELDEAFNRAVLRPGLANQTAYYPEDIAHAVIQLGNQQYLTLVRLLTLNGRCISHAKNDLNQRR